MTEEKINLWEEGDIAAAVTKAKNQGAVFIVFVQGKNELSSHYETLFNNVDISNTLKTKNFVAIKVEENSTPHQQFSAIYPHNSIPSIFFIGKNGKPIEIITENIQPDEFKIKIDNILETTGTTSILDHEKENALPPQTSSELSAEEKVEHAKELIEKKRLEKKKQEEEQERLKELERRKLGQNVQQMKKWQQDEELRQLKEERDKEKRENQAARDRVLAQIAQDKAERAAKFSPQTPSTSTQPPLTNQRSSPKSNVTKLQFKLPDGSQKTQEFKINDTLEIVHQFILNEMNLPFTNYTLSTSFPRREFNENDNCINLTDLQLVPNAVILIIPQNQGTVNTSNNGVVGSLFWWLLTPLFTIYDYFVAYFFDRTQTRTSVENTKVNKRSSEEIDTNTRKVQKKTTTDSTVIKKQGNIHRLSDRPDSDDDNNTWNGNSTQQM